MTPLTPMGLAIKEFGKYLSDHPNTEMHPGEIIFKIAKEYDIAPRDLFHCIIRHLRFEVI